MSEFDEMFGKPSQKYPTLEELAKMVFDAMDEAEKQGQDRANYWLYKIRDYAQGKATLEEAQKDYNSVPYKPIIDEITRAKEDNSYASEAFLNMTTMLLNSVKENSSYEHEEVYQLLNVLNKKPLQDKKLEYRILDSIHCFSAPLLNKKILIQKVKNPYVQKQDFIELARITNNKDELLNIWRASNEHFDKLIRNESKKEYPNMVDLKLLYANADNVQKFILETRAGNLASYGKTEFKEFQDLLAEFGDKYDFARIQAEQIPTHLDDFQKQIGEENSALKNDKAKAEEDLKAEKAKNEKLETENSDLKTKNQELTTTANNKEAELQDEIKRLNEQLLKKQEELESMTKQRNLYQASTEKFSGFAQKVDKYVETSNTVWKKDLKKMIEERDSQGK